ncbi:MAG: phenylalanine--tRNA ligase subunit beta [Firmicutes bacterium]|nr:phenylalanine--tRNA ligase subunit beta [Bacillota bacterium]
MRVSKSFLNDYVKVDDLDFHELADKMVFAGNEYESVEKISEATNIVVGHVLECEMHPESKKLHICKVDLGSEVVQILCGAPNMKQGIKVPVAKIGAKLPGGFEIKKAKLAGMDSNGMCCALEELGIESKYISEEEKNGIHVLPDDAEVGSDAIHYLGYDDEIIDFELTADRGDLLSMLGMAHEVGAIYNRPVTYPENNPSVIDENINDKMKLEVKTEKCPIYLGKIVKNVTIKESPQWMKTRLMASGIRPINNVVDISNYVMLEYGQPLHFFDQDRLGNHVVVRDAEEHETMKTLDGQERTLKSSDIVIANEKEPVALAGVMGGLSTEVEMDTKNIFVEAAIFDSVSIRYTAKAILRSEASNRYEKGIDPNRTKEALNRACYLLEKYADGIVLDGILTHDNTNKEDKVIDITLDKINSVLGMSLKVDEVIDVCKRLGFTVTEENGLFHVLIPTRRLDVNIKEDFIEEIGRIYGYEHVVGKLPVTKMKRGTRSLKEMLIKDIRNRLAGLGLTQVITYSLVHKNDVNKYINFDKEDIYLLDPLTEDRKYLRKSLIPSLLNVWEYNVSRNQKDIQIFETGNIYYKENDNYVEKPMIAGLVYGITNHNLWQQQRMTVDFYYVKGIIENLMKYLGLNNRYSFDTKELPKEYHPGRSASLIIDREIVGYFGQVHPKESKKEIYVFELDLEKIMSHKVRLVKFKEASKYPAIHKDLAFIVKKDITSKQIMDILKYIGGRMVSQIDVFDVYTGENVKDDEKSIAYSITFEDATRTLTDEEVMVVFNKMIENVEEKLDAKVRDK